MITKITAANADEFYNPRFAEITAALQASGKNIVVNSLETYFSNLTEIANLPTKKVIGQNTDGTPAYATGKYLVVPFDEPYFEIDANTRTIEVPAHFKKYGVGVQGDNLAEMLVFKVDRYFDHQDFLEADVAITWSFTPKGSRTPIIGTPQAGFAQDSELEPGYIIFGFIITRDMAQKLDGTLSSGTLTFAVTFYKQDADEKYEYRWNTQPVSVAINEGLELQDPTKVKDISRNLIARLRDSSYTPSEIAPLIEPYWMTGDIVEGPDDGIIERTGLYPEQNFHMNDDGTEDETLTLIAQAYSDSRATMKYRWYSGLNEDDILVAREVDSFTLDTDFMVTQDEEPVEDKVYYIGVEEFGSDLEASFEAGDVAIFELNTDVAVLTEDNEPMPAKTYYKHVDNTAPAMVKVMDSAAVEAVFNDDQPVYELGTSYTVMQAGSYQVTAQAEKEITQSNGNTVVAKSNSISSEICVVPVAAIPSVTLSVETTLENDYDIVNQEVADELTYIASDAAPRIIATVTSTNEQSLGAIALEAINNNSVNELSANEIIENTKSESNPSGKYEFSLLENNQRQVNADGVIAEGSYVVRAINRRNHSYAVSAPSEAIRTSFVAPRINAVTVQTVDGSTIVTLIDKGLPPINPDTNERANASIQLNSNYQSRRFTFIDESENLEGAMPAYFLEEVYDSGTPGNYQQKDPADDPADNITQYEIVKNGDVLTCTVADEGLYRVRIENVYNGTRRIGYTDVFSVERLS